MMNDVAIGLSCTAFSGATVRSWPDQRRASVLLLILALAGACAPAVQPPAAAPAPAPVRYPDVAAYRAAREKLIAEDRATRLGANLVLTPAEETANRRLMALKQSELDRTRAYFPPAHSFLLVKTKQAIAESPVFEVMSRLPKGGVLHAHGSALGDFRWLIREVSNRPDCYIYVGTSSTIPTGALRLAEVSPGDGWRPVSELRAAAADKEAFDDELFRSITLGEEDLRAPDIWQEFTSAFQRFGGLIGHRSVRADYWRNMLLALVDENIQYVESRSIGIDSSILLDVKTRDPDFDAKFIAAAGRSGTREQIAQALATAIDLRARDPNQVVGFDLVQEEDRTNTNLHYVEQLIAAQREAERRGVDLPFYLHSGETNWAENENLYDAILLGASRIGHGLALIKHPQLMEIVKARGIAVEVCPISNQVLGYVSDLRTHPAVHYINAGLPVVLSSDDPAVFRHTLSHDFYMAFMAWGLDLRSLKQLAMNSLTYSAMNPDEKRRALAAWERRWTTFIGWVNQRLASEYP
jgi:adenosine deaminase CECR1